MSKTHADSQIPNLRGAFTVFGGKYRSRQCIWRASLGIAILSCVWGRGCWNTISSRSMSSSRLNSTVVEKSTGAVHWFQELWVPTLDGRSAQGSSAYAPSHCHCCWKSNPELQHLYSATLICILHSTSYCHLQLLLEKRPPAATVVLVLSNAHLHIRRATAAGSAATAEKAIVAAVQLIMWRHGTMVHSTIMAAPLR